LAGIAQSLPYENYKGITDNGLAKEQWVKDNPEAYNQLVASSAAGNSMNIMKTSTILNDECATATPVACGTTVSGTNVNATFFNDSFCRNNNVATVWYALLGAGSAVTVSTCAGATFDTWITVYTGTCGTLSCVGSNDDFCGLQSSLTFTASLGQVYYVAVTGFAGDTGSFDLTITGSCTAPNSCSPININFSASGLKQPLWAPASDPYTFYYGLGDAKRINASVTGGVGPFSYAWSNSGTPALLPRSYYPSNSIDLFRPTAATYVRVTVTDNGTNCTYQDSVLIDWDGQYFCQILNNVWYVNVCQNGQSACVPWSVARSLRQSNSATLGNCVNPTKANDLNQVTALNIYPNPTNGLVTIELPVKQSTNGSMSVLDMSGRVLYTETINMQEGDMHHTFDVGHLPNGIYLIRVASANEVATERLQVLR